MFPREETSEPRDRDREREIILLELWVIARCHPLVVPFCSTRMEEGSHEPLSLSFSRVFSSRNIRQGRSNPRETNRSHGLTASCHRARGKRHVLSGDERTGKPVFLLVSSGEDHWRGGRGGGGGKETRKSRNGQSFGINRAKTMIDAFDLFHSAHRPAPLHQRTVLSRYR